MADYIISGSAVSTGSFGRLESIDGIAIGPNSSNKLVPTRKFYVSTATHNTFTINAGSGDATLQLTRGDSEQYYIQHEAGGLNFKYYQGFGGSYPSWMFVNNSLNIGIGTTSPDTELYVKGGATSGAITATTGTNKGILHIDGGTSNNMKHMITFGNQGTAATSAPLGVIGVHSNHSNGSGLFFGISTSYLSGVNSIPFVINPLSADGLFQLAGNEISGSSSSTGSFGAGFFDGKVSVGTTRKGTALGALLTLENSGASYTQYSVGSSGGGAVGSEGVNLVFYTYVGALGSESYAKRMTLNSGGNFSIGNTNNTYKLDVSGTGRFTGNLRTDSVLQVGGANDFLTFTSSTYVINDGGDSVFTRIKGYDDTTDMFFGENTITFKGNLSGSATSTGSFGHIVTNGHIVPTAAETFDLGSETKPFRDLHVSSGSIKMYAGSTEIARIQVSDDDEFEFFSTKNLSAEQKKTFTKAQIRSNATPGKFRGGNIGDATNSTGSFAKVGINTTTPNNSLVVKSAGSDDGIKLLESTGGTLATIFQSGDASGYPFFDLHDGVGSSKPTNVKVRINAGSTSWFDGGNVGIGTKTVDNLLHLYHASLPQIKLENSEREFIISSNTGDDLLSFYYAGNNRLQFNTTNQFFPTGNVGIGSTSPSHPLDVAGVIRTTGTGTSASVRINNTTSSTGNEWQLYSYNNGDFSIYQDGDSDRLYIKSNGNIGIGTTSPGYPLVVNKTESAASDFITNLDLKRTWSGGTSTDRLHGLIFSDFNSVNAGIFVNRYSSGANYNSHLEFYTNGGSSNMTPVTALGTPKMVIQHGGNVGIGIKSPIRKLQVNASSYTEAGGADANIHFSVANSTWSGIGLFGGTGQGGFIDFGDTDATHRGRILYSHASDYMAFNTAATEKLRIDSIGNVGIGVTPEATSTSHTALQIGGNAIITSYKAQGTSGEVDFGHNYYYAQSGLDKYISTDEATKFRLTSGHFRFYTAPSGTAGNTVTFTERLTILQGGNVGIGVTSPVTKLDVNGSILAGRSRNIGSYASDDFDLMVANGSNDATAIALFNNAGAFHTGLIEYYNNKLSLGLNNSNSDDALLATSAINITNTGVGIGTTAPSSLLDVRAESAAYLTVRSDDSHAILQIMADNDSTHTGNFNPSIRMYTGNSTKYWQIYGNDATTEFKIDYNSSNGFKMDSSRNVTIPRNLTVGGTITAQEFRTEFNTEVIIETSGSTKFGNTAGDDKHQFTGSIDVSGSITLNGSSVTSGGGGGGGISFNGSTTNGLVTFGNSTTADVESNLTFNGVDLVFGKGSVAGTAASIAHHTNNFFYITGGTEGLALMAHGGIDGIKIRDGGGSGNGSVVIETANAERMRVNGSGNVGIGNTSPSEKLEVAGGIAFSGTATMTAGTDTGKATIDTDGSDRMRFHINGANNGAFGGYEFRQSKGDHSDERLVMLIDETGKVGIGISAADGRLHVSNGLAGVVTANADADELVIENNGNAGISILTPDTSNGQIFFGDTSDNNIGIIDYDHNVNQLSFTVAANKAMTINASRNVGIGTTSPTQKLHVQGNLLLGNDSGAAIYFTEADSTVDEMMIGYDQSNSRLRFRSNAHSADRMVITKTGRVGIGTSSPHANSMLNVENTSGTAMIYLTCAAGSDTAIVFEEDATAKWLIGHDNSNSDAFTISDGNGFASGTKFTMLSSGNVGIGTTSPNTRLTLNGSSGDGWLNGLELQNSGTAIGRIIGDGEGMKFRTVVSGDHYYFRNSANTTTMKIESGGNVGIGTTSPVGKLDVRGTVTASMFHANASSDAGSPEYSFGTDPDTGMYSGGANVLAFSTAGTVRFTLNSAAFSSQVTGGARIVPANGSAAAPTFTFNDDPDTGMFRAAANTIAFGVGGNEGARIDSSQKVGLNGITPGNYYVNFRDLVIGGNQASGMTIRSSTTTTGTIAFANGTSGNGLYRAYMEYNHNLDRMELGTSGVGAMWLQNGNVGIGTTPATQYTTHTTQDYIIIGQASQYLYAANTGTHDIAISTNIHQDASGNYEYSTTNVGTVYKQRNGQHFFHTFASGTAGNDGTPNNALYIGNNGNIGMGTSSPDTKLTISGTNDMLHILATSGNHSPQIKFTRNASSYSWFIGMHQSSGLSDFHFRDSGGTVRMTLSTGGNLNVTGKLTATSKSFLIDHPTKENKKLQYASLEGPENGVYVRGKLEGDVIELPDYWVGLVHEDSITVNLTPIGKYQHLYVEDIKDNKVFVKCVGGDVKCFYTIYGERKDIEKLEVEF